MLLRVLALAALAATIGCRQSAEASRPAPRAATPPLSLHATTAQIRAALGDRYSGTGQTEPGIDGLVAETLDAVVLVFKANERTTEIVVRVLPTDDVDLVRGQRALVADVVRTATSGWPASRAWVNEQFVERREAYYAVDGFEVELVPRQSPSGAEALDFHVRPEPLGAQPPGVTRADLDAFHWVQRIEPMVGWAGSMCFLLERCLMNDPYTFNGTRYAYDPNTFTDCASSYETECRSAVDDLAAQHAPANIATLWNERIEDNTNTLRAVEFVRRLRQDTPRLVLRRDDNGFEDYWSWLDRNRPDLVHEYIDGYDAANAHRMHGYNGLQAWFDARFCCTNGTCYPNKIGDMVLPSA